MQLTKPHPRFSAVAVGAVKLNAFVTEQQNGQGRQVLPTTCVAFSSSEDVRRPFCYPPRGRWCETNVALGLPNSCSHVHIDPDVATMFLRYGRQASLCMLLVCRLHEVRKINA
jgi:hypothetical protein